MLTSRHAKRHRTECGRASVDTAHPPALDRSARGGRSVTQAGRQPGTETGAAGDRLLIALGLATFVVYAFALLLPFSVFEHGASRLLSFAGETGRGAGGFAHYLSAMGVPFLLYLAALGVVVRRRVSLVTILIFSGLFGATLMLVYPLTAIDAFAYAAQTRLFTEYGANPHTVPANSFVGDPFLQWAAFLDRPSPYGPMWTYIASVPTLLGGDEPMRAALGMKALALASHLASTVLAYAIAQRWRPGSGPLAALLLAWNPLVLWSSAGDGHNDAVMMALVLLAIFLLQRRPILGVPTLVLAGMVKFVALALGPIFLLYLWRRGESPRFLAGTLAISAALAVVVIAPFWEGTDTLDGLRPQGSMETMSPGALIITLEERFDVSEGLANGLARGLMYALFLAIYVRILTGVGPGPESLARASFLAVFALMVLAIFWFRFWFLIWLVPLAAILPPEMRRLRAVGVAFSGTGILLYLFTDYLWIWLGLRLNNHLAAVPAVFLLPVLLWAWPARSAAEAESGRVPGRTYAALARAQRLLLRRSV